MTRNYIFPSILIVVLMQSCVSNAVLNVDGCLKNPGVVNRENSVSIYQKSVKKKNRKIGKSDFINIDRIDQSVEIDDQLVSFIGLCRFYRFHRFISEGTSFCSSVHSQEKMISCKQ